MIAKHDNPNSASLADLFSLVRTLRKECPWDRKQTPQTTIMYLIEEVYELFAAITDESKDGIVDEIGDVMFLLFFLVHLYEQQSDFSLSEVIEKNRKKMVRRHPHVFGENQDLTPSEIEKNWAIIKADEKGNKQTSCLDSIPKGLPSLQRAYMISEKVGKRGFDWDDMAGVVKKVEEEWAEFHAALREGDKNHVAMEFGDLLFTLTNIARFADIHPETALSRSVNKFEARYRHMEKALYHLSKSLDGLSPEEKDRLWEDAKKKTASVSNKK